jgi:hypothetical protein
MKKVMRLVFAAAVLVGLASCNSNDDFGAQNIEIPGITIDESDADCCSAEEALAVYNFLQTVKPIDGIDLVVDGQYKVNVYSRTGTLHTGYNDLYFVATKASTGNYIKFLDITNLTPLMFMSKMNMYHSTPTSSEVATSDINLVAVKHGWISFVMNTSDAGSWSLAFDAEVLKKKGSLEATTITVGALPEGQQWLKSFKVENDTYYLSLVNPTDWKTGTNTITAYVSKKNTPAKIPYGLAEEQFTIEIDPRMPDMGNHSSPNNVALTRKNDGSYQGSINLTMTGRWRIHLTVKDAQGNIVAGGDDLSDGFSSLFWETTI